MLGDPAVEFLYGLLDARNIKYCLKSAEACFHLLWAFDGDEKQYITRGFLSVSVSEDIDGVNLHKAALSQRNCF